MIFNAISAAEMAALPKELQLDLLSEFHLLPEDLTISIPAALAECSEEAACCTVAAPKIIGSISKGIRKGFSFIGSCTKIPIRDFLYRSNLPMDEEDEQLGSAKEFWKLIEEAEKKP